MATEFYRSEAPPGSQVSSPHQQEILAEFLRRATATAPARLAIDVGSGQGSNLRTLSTFADRVVAVDISEDALRESRTGHTGAVAPLGFLSVDGAALPFPDNAFDLIVCTEVLEHVGDFPTSTRELQRVTAPGGHLVVSTPNYRNVMGLVKAWKDWRSGRHDYDPWHAHAGGHEGFMTAGRLRGAFGSCEVLAARGADYAFALGITWPPARRRLSKYLLLRPGHVGALAPWGMQYYLLLRRR